MDTYSLSSFTASTSTGIFSGFVVIALIWWYKRIFLSWIRNSTYGGITLTGTWERTWETHDKHRGVATYTVKQKGNRISGVEVMSKLDLKGNILYQKKFAIEGKISQRIVMLVEPD